MEIKSYAIYDSKTKTFDRPMFMLTNGQAIRGWETVCNDEKSDYYKYPDDFTLFEIGSYDDSKGNFTNLMTPVSLGLAAQYKKPPEKNTPLEEHIAQIKRSS